MRSFFTILLLLFCVQLASAQTKPELRFEKGGVIGDDQVLKMSQVLALMEDSPEALSYMKKAKTNAGFMQVFGFAGGFLIGMPLGTAVGGGDPNWGLAGVGAGLILVALPFNSAFKKNASMAIDLYNKDNQTAGMRRYRLDMGFVDSGVGFKLSF